MAIEALGNSTGTMDPVEAEYIKWAPAGSAISIRMHPGVVEGIARDVAESFGGPSRPGSEVGGLLLGRVETGALPVVWIERYQRLVCEHRFGPHFILDSEEMTALEKAAATIAAGETAVVGLYRSHVRPGFQLEDADFNLIRSYFSDPTDLILLIKPKSAGAVSGQFYVFEAGSGSKSVGGEFPLREPADTEATGVGERKTQTPAVPREIPRRLVPDFLPAPAEPSPSLYGLSGHSIPEPQWSRPEELTAERGMQERLRRWLPLLAALLLVGGILWFLLRPGGQQASNPAPPQASEPARPLGLYVDPAGQSWRISWNPNATALHDKRSVQLFVREKDDQKGDDQNRLDLSASDLASGSREYRPMGNDVTFRLEVVDHGGRVSAESFRFVRAVTPSAPSNAAPAPEGGAGHFVQPKAVYRAPPVVAAGVRPRIKGRIPIDVRVQIDARGRVVSATPVAKPHSGLDEYLAARAVQAARLWRFEAAREDGKSVAGTQIIHFVFEK